jgi:hypothetical protein
MMSAGNLDGKTLHGIGGSMNIAEIREREKMATFDWLPGYEVHSDGSVWSTKSNWRGYGVRELKASPNSFGYYRVRVTVNGQRKSVFVAHLVALAFLPSRPETRCELRHLDGDKSHNQSANLKWGTAKDNADDRERHGHTAKGSRNGASKLAESDVLKIKCLLIQRVTKTSIAKRFGVSPTTIGQIARKEIWANVNS